jgi:hypothetical protein
MKKSALTFFEGKQIRRKWDSEKELWYFAVVDVIAAITDSRNPQVYWRVLKKRLHDEGANETVTKCNGLKMVAPDGKMRLADVADTETIFRLIQSIPSPNAEPFKLWLARVGYERVEEAQDPELTINRALNAYRKLGRSDAWINQRLKSIEIRKDLTNEWESRGVQEGLEFAILTDDITYAWAGLSTRQYKNLKRLKKENLRDHMTNLELVLNMLAEASTTEISKKENPQSFLHHRIVARKGGNIAGIARKKLEKETKKSVIGASNYLPNEKKKLHS